MKATTLHGARTLRATTLVPLSLVLLAFGCGDDAGTVDPSGNGSSGTNPTFTSGGADPGTTTTASGGTNTTSTGAPGAVTGTSGGATATSADPASNGVSSGEGTTGTTTATSGGSSGSDATSGTTGSDGGVPTDGGDTSMDAGLADGGLPDEGGSDDATMEMPEPVDYGEGDGSDVITIGDSWMDYVLSGGGIEAALRSVSGKRYRNYGVSATRLLNGQIPGQYDRAKRENPDIKTVIMTGGGNDILLGGYSCDTAEDCQEYVTDLIAALDELWTKMSADGVKDVIYINYAASAGDSPADARPDMLPKAEICETGPIRCHSLDTTDLVMDDLLDGIHPTSGANRRIAEAVVAMMEERGMRR